MNQQQLLEAGFSQDEINQYAGDKRAKLRAAGFSGEEIDKNFGTVTAEPIPPGDKATQNTLIQQSYALARGTKVQQFSEGLLSGSPLISMPAEAGRTGYIQNQAEAKTTYTDDELADDNLFKGAVRQAGDSAAVDALVNRRLQGQIKRGQGKYKSQSLPGYDGDLIEGDYRLDELGSAHRQYTGPASEFHKTLVRSTFETAGNLAGAAEKIFNFASPTSGSTAGVSDWLKDIASVPELQPGEGGGKTAFVVNSIGSAIPFMTGTVAATMTGGPIAGWTVAAGVMGDQAYDSAIKQGASQPQALMEGLTVGGLTAFAQNIRIGSILKTANVTEEAFVSAARQTAYEKMQELGTKLTRETFKSAVENAALSTLQQTVIIATPAIMRGQEAEDWQQQLLEAGIGGGIVGSFFGVGMGAIESIGKRKTATAENKSFGQPEVSPVASPVTGAVGVAAPELSIVKGEAARIIEHSQPTREEINITADEIKQIAEPTQRQAVIAEVARQQIEQETPAQLNPDLKNALQPDTEAITAQDVSISQAERVSPAAEAGSKHRWVTEESYKASLKNLGEVKLYSGLPVDKIPDLIKVSVYHFEGGARTFTAWSAKMLEQFGEKIRPHLKEVWQRITAPRNIDKAELDKRIERLQAIIDGQEVSLTTGIPTRWQETDTLYKGKDETLRTIEAFTDPTTGEKTKAFNKNYLNELVEIPVGVQKLLRAVKDRTQEVWAIKLKEGKFWVTDHYLAPKKIVDEIRAVMSEEDLKPVRNRKIDRLENELQRTVINGVVWDENGIPDFMPELRQQPQAEQTGSARNKRNSTPAIKTESTKITLDEAIDEVISRAQKIATSKASDAVTRKSLEFYGILEKMKAEHAKALDQNNKENASQLKEQIDKLETARERIKKVREQGWNRLENQLEQQKAKAKATIQEVRQRAQQKLETATATARQKISEIIFDHRLKKENISAMADMVNTFVPATERGRFLKRVTQATTIEARSKLATDIFAYVEEYEHREAIRSLIEYWQEIKPKYKRGNVVLGKLRDATRANIIDLIWADAGARKQMLDLIGDVDLVELSEAKEERLRSLSVHLQRLGGAIAGGIEDLNANTAQLVKIPNGVIDELKRLNQTSVRALSTEEIRFIEQSLRQLIHVHELKNEILFRGRQEAFDNIEKRATLEIAATKEAIEQSSKPLDTTARKTAIQKLKELATLDNLHIDSLIELATENGSSVTKDVIINALYDGENKTIGKFRDAVAFMRQRLESIGLSWEEFKQIHDTDKGTKHAITFGGIKGIISSNHLISLYLNCRNPENLSRIFTSSGLKFGDKTFPTPTMQELRTAIASLSDKEKAFGQSYAEVNKAVLAPAINAVTRRLFGCEIARDVLYYPLHVVQPELVSDRRVNILDENAGRYMPRIGSSKPLELRPFTKELATAMQSDSAFFGMTEPLGTAKALLNTKSWQDAMDQSGHTDIRHKIMTLIENVTAHTTDASMIDAKAQALLNRIATATLSLRISTLGTQLIGTLTAAAEIPTRYLSKTLVPIPISEIKSLMNYSPFFWQRYTGGKINLALGSITANHTLESYIYGKTPMRELGLQPMEYMDMQSAGNIKRMVERWLTAETTMQPNTREFKEAVAKKTEYIVRRTQGSWSMLDRSIWSDPSRGAFVRSFTMFRTSSEAELNMLFRAANRYAKSDHGTAERARAAKDLAAVIGTEAGVTVWRAALRWGLRAGAAGILATLGIYTKDQIEEAGKALEDTAWNLPSNILGVFPGAQDAANLILEAVRSQVDDDRKFRDIAISNPLIDWGNSGLKVIEHLAAAIKTAFTGEKIETGIEKDKAKWIREGRRAADNLLSFASNAAGLPYNTLKQQFINPFTQRSQHEIVRELSPDVADNFMQLGNDIENVYKQRDDLAKRKKLMQAKLGDDKAILPTDSEYKLRQLDAAIGVYEKTTKALKQTSDPDTRKGLFDSVKSVTDMVK